MTELQKENLEGNYKAWSPARKEKEEKKKKSLRSRSFSLSRRVERSLISARSCLDRVQGVQVTVDKRKLHNCLVGAEFKPAKGEVCIGLEQRKGKGRFVLMLHVPDTFVAGPVQYFYSLKKQGRFGHYVALWHWDRCVAFGSWFSFVQFLRVGHC
jgi:hypothetical protein